MAAVWIIIGVIAFTILAMVIASHHPFFKMTSSTTGEVITSDQREVRDDRERRDETVIRFKYAVHGKPYERERVIRGRIADRFPPGSRVPVKYNPAEPDMADIRL
jgi:hypothetical protein